MGKVYLVPAGVTRPVAGWDDMGPDADDPALTIEAWRERIRPHRGELKNLLKDQAFVAGIGNGYADEILWEARLAPLRKRSTLAADEVDALYAAVRSVPRVGHRRAAAAGAAPLRGGGARLPAGAPQGRQPLPQVWHHHQRDRPGGFVTSWCRTCQR